MTLSSTQPPILVLEDDAEMRQLMIEQLKNLDHPIQEFHCGSEAIQKIKSGLLSGLLILDWTLPEVSGEAVIRSIRQSQSGHDVFILVLTANPDPEHLKQVLECGADDYLLKPFDRAPLVSKVRFLLRRFKSTSESESSGKIVIDPVTIHPASYDVFCGSERVHLTPSEFKLLLALAQRTNEVFSREQLIEQVQGEGVVVIDRAIDTHIFGLRKKLSALSDRIETIRGVGYRLK